MLPCDQREVEHGCTPPACALVDRHRDATRLDKEVPEPAVEPERFGHAEPSPVGTLSRRAREGTDQLFLLVAQVEVHRRTAAPRARRDPVALATLVRALSITMGTAPVVIARPPFHLACRPQTLQILLTADRRPGHTSKGRDPTHR